MLKYALMAIAGATAIAVVFILLPTGGGQRPEPRILSSGDTVPANGFVIHPAGPPDPNTPALPANTPASPTAPAGAADLDAVMQRLRAGTKPDPAAPQTPGSTALSSTTTATAAPGTSPTPGAATILGPPGAPAAPTPDATAAATRWSSVTGQGTRWRMAKSAAGYTISIDIGNGQVADVHVQPAFGGLDPASVNVRVDYLHDTIMQNFAHQSATYSFARDGSISLEP